MKVELNTPQKTEQGTAPAKTQECSAWVKRQIYKADHPEYYKEEDNKTNDVYPPEYKGPKPIRKQVDFLAEEFNLSPDEALEFIESVLPTLVLPAGAEGWFAIPAVEVVAQRCFPEITGLANRYCHAVKLVLEKISQSREFSSRKSKQEIIPSRFHQHERTFRFLGQITKQQESDILIVPAQFGMRHRGRSIRWARECFVENEFGLGSFAIGCMLLTHSERLGNSWEELIIDCPGDEFSTGDDGNFPGSRYFTFGIDNKIHFSSCYIDEISGKGSASGFIPQ